ncbi:MAG: hypothetical protein HKP38_10305 [Croceitalea sp.]|nr:hypothetical protein [Croceitalea sp.]NNC33980.1 hypothetical protein [Croceitalea sp.]NNL09604.1 hypothetical protein [Croceitalea sp.]
MRSPFFLSLLLLMSCSQNDDVNPLDSEQDDNPNAFKELVWFKTIGGSGEDTAQAIIQTSDGGLAILGHTNSIDGDIVDKSLEVNDYWLIKMNVDGNLQWNKTYGGSKDDRGQQLIETDDGGFAIVGYSMSDDRDASNNEGFHDNWILRLDASGTILWERSFGFSGHDHSYDVLQTSDGGFFFSGFLDVTQSQGEGNFGKGEYLTRHGVGEFWGTKLDADGNLQWRRYFGGTNNDRAHGVVQANDGGFVMAGFSESDDFDISNSKGSYDFWVVKIDKNGNMIWEKSFGGSGIEIAYDITKNGEGGYSIVGNTFSTDTDVSKNNGESDVWLINIDDNGNLLWEKTYGGSAFDAAQGISLAANGGFVMAGNTKSMDGDVQENLGENDIWLITTKRNGELLYQKTFGGLGLDYGFDAIQTNDGSLVIVGETASTNIFNTQIKGPKDALVIKVR